MACLTGHLSMQLVQRLISQVSLLVKALSPSTVYHVSYQAKSYQLLYSSRASTSLVPLQLHFADIWGPSLLVSRGDFRYYLSFVDDYSRFTWLFPLKCKSDVISVFPSFKHNVELLLNTKIKATQFDNGGEFQALTRVLHTFGISHRLSCPYAHRQNGTVECKHRHILEIGLALLSYSFSPTCIGRMRFLLQFSWSIVFLSLCCILESFQISISSSPRLHFSLHLWLCFPV